MKQTLPIIAVALAAMTAQGAGLETAAPGGETVAPASMRKEKKLIPPEEWKFKFSEADIVRDTPEGEKALWSKSCDYYSSTMFGVSQGSTKGMPCTVVEGADGAFWIYAPFAGIDTRSWLKADIDGDVMTVNLPQAIYSDGDDDGNTYVYVAQMCHFELEDPDDGSGRYFAEEGDTQLVFNKEGDTWKMQMSEVNDKPMVMGLVAADDGTWCIFSDWNIGLTPFDGELLELPAGVNTEKWEMVIQVDGNYVTGQDVNVGFDGDDVYLNGISSMFPDAWIKGSVADGKVSFPSHQYIGADEVNSSFGFFYGATEELVYNEEWDFWYTVTNFADNLIFDYDPAARTMTTEGTLLINRGDWEVYAIESFTAPRMAFATEVTDFRPMNPVQSLFSEAGDYAGSEYFDFPTVNSSHQLLDTSKLYYRVYLDNELLTFYPDEYVGLDGEASEIPFLFTNQNNMGFYGICNCTHFFTFTFTGFETMGIQTLYRDGDNVYESDIVTAYSAGIDEMAESEVASIEWYDIAGCRVQRPDKGIYIKRTVYENGSVKTAKTIVR